MKENMFSYAKKDMMSGLIVFLIALPLCLGIAQASGAPLFSGIVAGIVGGVVIGYFSGSQLSVSGPAAGLVVIVAGAISELSDQFGLFLCAVIIAGVIQLILGFVRAGGIASYFPTSVIEGMLAGIGLSIIIKQIPIGMGFIVPKNNSGMEDAENGFIFSDIVASFQNPEPGAIIICVIGVVILAMWNWKAFQKVRMIPVGLLVVVLGTLINLLFQKTAPSLYLSGDHLVNLKIPDSVGAFFGQFTLPTLGGFANPIVWKYGIIIAVVASIETLLCIEATDKLDPWKRVSSTNKELKAQGLGNIVSGLIGGLPITSVIVRSSANINAGGKTRLATITHGILLLVSVATIPMILNMIPRATLASILVYTGYRLCRPAVFKHMYHNGLAQFLPFVVTVLGVVFLDLLKGVGIGAAIAIFFILRNNFKVPFFYKRRTYKEGSEVLQLELSQEVTFLNKASIKDVLEAIPNGSSIILDATNTEYIDFDVLEMIKEFHASKAPDRNINLSLVGFKNTYHVPEQLVASDVLSLLPEAEPHKITAGTYKKLMKQLKT